MERENERDGRFDELEQQVIGEEVAELLRYSTIPPPAGADTDEDDFGPVVPAEVVARAVAQEGRNSVLFLPQPRRDRHVAAWIGAAVLAGLFLAGGYSFATLRDSSAQARPDSRSPTRGRPVSV